MRLLHHHDSAADVSPGDRAPTAVDPVAAAVWRSGLTGAAATGSLVIHAPHASELVGQATPAPDAHAA